MNSINAAGKLEKEAREEKGFTGTNVAAGLLFWPALIGNYVNAEEAIEAAEERKDYLFELAEQKKCKI